MIRAPSTAVQKPCTSKPVMTSETIFSIRALIRKVKRPRVRMLMGNVRRIRRGRKKAFRIPSTAAASKAGQRPETRMPSRSQEATRTATVRTSQRNKTPRIIAHLASAFFENAISLYSSPSRGTGRVGVIFILHCARPGHGGYTTGENRSPFAPQTGQVSGQRPSAT
jgi:hypothetical protein